MKIISHRGNLDGPNLSKENHPNTIDIAISLGFDVEVDIYFDHNKKLFYLGHDQPQYNVSLLWLNERINNLWLHCKNIEALYEFTKLNDFNYFWHQKDNFTLTSKKYIWTYPGQPHTTNSIIVLPETYIKLNKFDGLFVNTCYGMCTDYPKELYK